MRLASVPARTARRPRLAISPVRSGASGPMPPIWMPMDDRLAKPHSANVAMMMVLGSRLPAAMASAS